MASSNNAGDYIVGSLGQIATGIGYITGAPQAEAALAMSQIEAEKAALEAQAQSSMYTYALVGMGLFGAAILGAAYLFRR